MGKFQNKTDSFQGVAINNSWFLGELTQHYLIEEVRRVQVGDLGLQPAGCQRRALFLPVVRRVRVGMAAVGAPAEGELASGTWLHARIGQSRVAAEANWKK